MPYRILTDLVLLLHLLFILFVVAGGILTLYRKWWALLHLPAMTWGIYIEFSGDICPLTPLENHFNRLAGKQGYSSDFLTHYLLPLIYPAALTPRIQIFFGLVVIISNLAVYSFLMHRHFRRKKENSTYSPQ